MELTHNVFRDGALGIRVSATARLSQLKGVQCLVTVECRDAAYKYVGNAVQGFVPKKDYVVQEIPVFLPYLALNLPEGEHDLSAKVSLVSPDSPEVRCEHEPVGFHLSKGPMSVKGRAGDVPKPPPPPASYLPPLLPRPGVSREESGFEEVKVEHNVSRDGVSGMRVVATARPSQLKSKTEHRVFVEFYGPDDRLVGEASHEFVPRRANAAEDIEVFAPYLFMRNLPDGEHDVSFRLLVECPGAPEVRLESEVVSFHLSKGPASFMGR